jgi:DNA primase
LKAEERKGLSHLIVEVVRFRDYFVQEFEEARQKIVSELKKDLQGESYKGRILENVSILVATHKIMAEKLDLKFTFNQVYNEAKTMIVSQSEQISDSDAMGSFWKMLAFLSFDYKIQENQDYIIREEHSITVRNGKEEETIAFSKPTNVLYIQLTKIHPLYMAEHRKQHGENGVSEQSIRAFIKSSKYFIGNIKSISFEGVKTSAYAFYFDAIGVNLKRHVPNSGASVPASVPVPTSPSVPDELPF